MSELIQGLQSIATLASCTISKWDAKITSKSAMRKLNDLEQATGDTGEVRIKLLANADTEYKRLCSQLDVARSQVHYKLTLPWAVRTDGIRGPRLLPNAHFETYIEKISIVKSEIAKAKADFAKTLPASIAKAQQTLGGLAAHYVYPAVDDIVDRFDITIDIQPIPDSASFKGFDSDTMKALEDQMEMRTKVMVDNAMAEVWQQAKDSITHLVDRLQTDEEGNVKRLYTSTVENVRHLVKTLGGFNLTGDKRIEQLQAELETMLKGTTITDLRDNDNTRERVLRHADGLRNRIDQWGI